MRLQKKKPPSILGSFPVFPFLCLGHCELGSRAGGRALPLAWGLGASEEHQGSPDQERGTSPSPCSGVRILHLPWLRDNHPVSAVVL